MTASENPARRPKRRGSRPSPSPSPSRPAGEPAAYKLVAGVLRTLMRRTTRPQWRGTENIPVTGGLVIVANHISHFDPLVLAHVVHDRGRTVRFLAKSSLFSLPVLGRIIRATGQIPVFRNSTQAGNAFRAAVAAVRAGDLVIVYPEATITKDPRLWPMIGKSGAARIAVETGCPVIPIATWGAQQVIGPDHKGIRLFPRKRVQAIVGEPVDLSGFAQQPVTAAGLRGATELIMRRITDLVAELRCEPAPAEPYDPRRARS